MIPHGGLLSYEIDETDEPKVRDNIDVRPITNRHRQ